MNTSPDLNTCLVFGRTGQVGQSIAKAATNRPLTLTQLGREEADLTRPQCIADIITQTRPRVVINASAYTKVDNAETDEATAHVVNALAPAAMAQACHTIGASLIHFSTDYVFPGTSTHPYGEQDATGPTGAYGRTKEEGERLIRQTLERHIILRTSWVFSATGQNFVKTMLNLKRDLIRVVDDQTGNPTPADAIAQTALLMAEQIITGRCDGRCDTWGTFHYCGTPPTTWFKFAQAIFAEAARYGHPQPRLEPIATADYPTPAKRPPWSVLNADKIQRVWNISPPDWRSALQDVVAQLLEPKA